MSKSEEILQTIDGKTEYEIWNINKNESFKTLGPQWNQRTDTFSFSMHPSEFEAITKRTALSYLAKIFDPLGWLTLVTITAKLFI